MDGLPHADERDAKLYNDMAAWLERHTAEKDDGGFPNVANNNVSWMMRKIIQEVGSNVIEKVGTW